MSSVNDLNPHGFKEEHLNLLKNHHMQFFCGPLVYKTIIDWGFTLPKDKKLNQHIHDLKIIDKIKANYGIDHKKWMQKNKSKFEKDSFSDFDITALHDLLPILCYDKFHQFETTEYNEKLEDRNSVETLLKEIKTFRNNVSHEQSDAVKDNISKMAITMRKCIIAAGKLYGKDDTEIDEKVKLLDDEFDKILLDPKYNYEDRVRYIAKKISSEVPSHMLEKYSNYFSIPLPGNSPRKNTLDIFQFSELSVIPGDYEDKEDEQNKTVIPCTKIYNNKPEKVIVINGGPGSGKTTLMRNMCKDILETSVTGSTPRYEKIEQFKIPIYLECRYEQQEDLGKFLRECLKDFLFHEDDICEAFKLVEGLVFIIDGYDEITDKCRRLVDSIIHFCRNNNASCIVSSRVDAGNNLVNELQQRTVNYTKMFIEPIGEMSDKVKFLESYAGNMDSSIDTNQLVNSFKNLTAAAQEVFSSPILLALFISLFVNDQDSVSQMKNELSAYEAVRTNFLYDMTKKLKTATNAKGRAKDVANVLGKFSLKLLREKKFFLEGKDYSDMVAECEKINGMPDNVGISSLFSCILTPEHSLKYTIDPSYQFFHSTIQEFFAAKYAIENIRDLQYDCSSLIQLASCFFSGMIDVIVKKFLNPAIVFQDDRSFQSQTEDRQLPKLLHALELKESQTDIKEKIERYGNIIKFLMLETLATAQLSKFSDTFTLMLKKYYKPKGYSPVYHLDLILSSDSNADIISIVSDCLRGWERYELEYHRHIKPMIEVVQTFQTGVMIDFISHEVTNTQQIFKLLTMLGDDSEIKLNLRHSYNNYKPLEGEFYTHLKNSKCKITAFWACIASTEHLSIVVGVVRGLLYITTPSVFEINLAALEGHEGDLGLRVKYTQECPSTGSNPVKGGTRLRIDNIPSHGKENLYKTIKYICPISKKFWSICLLRCHLTDTDTSDLLKKLEEEKIGTEWGNRTQVKRRKRVHQDESRDLELHLKESHDVVREEDREKRKKGKRKIVKRKERRGR